MSAANSAAKKRRAPTSMEQPPQQYQPQQQQQTGFTLPQVISLLDSRLSNLEKNTSSTSSDMTPEYIEEFETRFEILAEEISSLKQIVLSLQSYTMDVNKILMEEKLKPVL
jgi:predicted DNA-binding protein